MKKGMVSVIIPNYNYAHFIEETMQSVIDQTYKNWEMIVIDDNSIDNSRDVITEFIRKNTEYDIKLIHNNTGPSGTPTPINIGIKNMSGEYFAWLSSDDVFIPTKLEEQVRILKASLNVGMVHTSCFIIDDDSVVIREYYVNDYSRVEFFIRMLKQNTINCNTILVRKSVFDKVGVYMETNPLFPCIWLVSEYLKYLEIAMHFDVVGIRKKLHKTRIHNGNRTYAETTLGLEILKVSKKFFFKDYPISKIMKQLNISPKQQTAYLLKIWELVQRDTITGSFISEEPGNKNFLERLNRLEYIKLGIKICTQLVVNRKFELAHNQVKKIDELIDVENLEFVEELKKQELLKILNEAKKLFSQREFELSEKVFQLVLEDKYCPDNLKISALYYQALGMAKKGDTKRQKQILKKLLELEPCHNAGFRMFEELRYSQNELKKQCEILNKDTINTSMKLHNKHKKKLRILLINPPYVRFLNMSNNLFPLSFGNIATILSVNNHNVAIYNADFQVDPLIKKPTYEYTFNNQHKINEGLNNKNHQIWKEIKQNVQSFNPDLVGISTMSNKYPIVLKIAEMIKAHDPNIQIVLGGPHTSIQSERIMENVFVDFVVVGEGEITFLELINQLVEKKPLFVNIHGLVFRKNNKIIKSPPRKLIKNLDTLPIMDRRLMLNTKHIPDNNIMVSRGCPFNCSYCGSKTTWEQKLRRKSVAYVIKEIKKLFKLSKLRHISFWDDSFTVNKKYTLELLNSLKSFKNLSFSCITRVDLLDEELLKELKMAGCTMLLLGIESGNQKILDSMNKNVKLNFIRDTILKVRNNNIKWTGFFMMGYPGETIENINQTLEFMKELKPDHAEINVFTPLPGTPVWTDLEKSGLINMDIDFSKLSQSRLDHFYNSKISNVEFKKLALSISREFDNYNLKYNAKF